MENKKSRALAVGLDIGIASVGWAVLAPDHIVALGVRTFKQAETEDKGESLNLARRTARLTRTRLHRRAARLTRLASALQEHGLINDATTLRKPPAGRLKALATCMIKDAAHLRSPTQSPWVLRVAGLDRRLDPEEWARVLYHICKHRGFYWAGLGDQDKDGADTGRIKEALAEADRHMESENCRTVAEMVLRTSPDRQRNKQGDYKLALSRAKLGEELQALFNVQRDLGNPYASSDLEHVVLGENGDRKGLFWEQRPPLSGASLLKMLGRCTFEPSEYRAPKNSFSAERHVWLTRLNNLRVIENGTSRQLNSDERDSIMNLPYEKTRVTYEDVRKKLQNDNLIGEEFWFAGLSYRDGENPEAKGTVCRLLGWHRIKKTLASNNLKDAWSALSLPALKNGKGGLLDDIARVLSVYKDIAEAHEELEKLPLPDKLSVIAALTTIDDFTQFSNLSLKALRKILPHMELGHRYDQACELAGYDHSHVRPTKKSRYLPPLYLGRNTKHSMEFNKEIADVPRNPVVLRSLSQARKVVNAIVRKYGSPATIHIEMARDLSRSLSERRKIEKAQLVYREENEKSREHFEECFGHPPKGQELVKFLLYREQHGKCAYSLQALDVNRLLEPKYVEVDHVLPYSRSYDNTKNNQVLVLSKENQNKGNRTPYEYLDGETPSKRWEAFAQFVKDNKPYRQAKRNRLLRKNFGPEESKGFRERNLNDTRYVCRFFKNYIEQHLLLADESDRRCVVVNGQLTGFIRARWGLSKIREESDRHHALDAAVVAACDHGMVKRVADYHKQKKLAEMPPGYIDPETGEVLPSNSRSAHSFPVPWEHFRSELELRLQATETSKLRDGVKKIGTYPEHEINEIKPIFVSRAPQRRGEGPVHKETIYSMGPKRKSIPKTPFTSQTLQQVVQKVPLSSLKLDDMSKLVDWERNKALYEAIEARLREHGGDGTKAFSSPLHRPGRPGSQCGPIVRSVKLNIGKLTGVPVRCGIAKNDTMLRIDVFQKDQKFYVVPVYMYHKRKKNTQKRPPLPDRAIVGNKDESEWVKVDDSFSFLFSVYPNDLLRITAKGKTILGYYAQCDRSTGAISLWLHDRDTSEHKKGLVRSIGIRTATSVEKLHVDVLGNLFNAPHEKYRELA